MSNDIPAPAPFTEPATEPYPTDPDPTEQDRRRGPQLAPLLLGLACLLVAGAVAAQELGGLSIDWDGLGPLGIVAAGLVLVAVGGLALLGSRGRTTAPPVTPTTRTPGAP